MKTFKIIFSALVLCILSLNSYSQIKINSSGKVGINNTSPSYQLDLDGDFYFDLSGTSVIKTQNGADVYFDNNDMFTSTYVSLGKDGYWWDELWAWSPNFYNYPNFGSDISLKKDIKDIDSVILKLTKLRPVSYSMLTQKEYLNSIGKESTSFANDKKKSQIGFIAQEVQQVFPELVNQIDSSYLGISYIEFIPLLIKGFQEQQVQIDQMTNELTKCCQTNLKSSSLNSSDDLKENQAKLYQNAPNPFSIQTIIRFEIPETTRNAQLHLCNMTGTLLKTIQINQRGAGNILVNANEFVAGMYLYSLVCDGRIVDTKQMLLTE